MNYTIVGLGNPGEEYENTRHNVGRIVVEEFAKMNDFDELVFDKKVKGLTASGKVGKSKVLLLEPETFMNKSGDSVKCVIKSKKDALGMILIHDDLDLPFGKFKISFNKSSGGHRGVEAVIKAINTTEFARVRVGISKSTPSGKLKKPTTEKDVIALILGKFSKSEFEVMKKVSVSASEALKMIIEEGREKTMGEFNGR
ncbi:MAG: aminoacyl-tRNA hydrolase [Minisyncoccia bacterium]